ncbi:hypothetical protein AMTRI_Chr07g78230 [Amborella trichopoda]
MMHGFCKKGSIVLCMCYLLILELSLLSLLEWKIENLLSITLDNASYNDVVASSLVSQLSRKSALLLNGKIFHLHCLAHVLNLFVQDGVRVINEIIDKIREVIKVIRGS